MPTNPYDLSPEAQSQAIAKEAALRELLQQMKQVWVAYSAGVDSTYLLAVAHQELGNQAQAVTADSASMARSSLNEATTFCHHRGITHHVVATDEFEREAYIANQGMRCYECKAALFRAMDAISSSTTNMRQTSTLLLGALAEDFSDIRPGLKAAAEAGAKWPLADVGLHKAEVRFLSKQLGLHTWNRPAEPCLSSRFPYGEAVTKQGLSQIEQAEAMLRFHGFNECRARHHQVGSGTHQASLCRIEIPQQQFSTFMQEYAALCTGIKQLGYQYVTLDLAGLQSGGFNHMLSSEEQNTWTPST